MSENPQPPATATDLVATLEAMSLRASAPYGYDGDEALAWESGWESGIDRAAEVVRNFLKTHPATFQSLTGEQIDAIKDVVALSNGYTRRTGQAIDAHASRLALLPITDPDDGQPAKMAPYLSFHVAEAAENGRIVATFDTLADANSFALAKTAQGEPHVVRF